MARGKTHARATVTAAGVSGPVLVILGTLARLVDLLAVPVLLWWLVGHLVTWPHLPSLKLTPLFWWEVAGLMLADTLHWVLDRFCS